MTKRRILYILHNHPTVAPGGAEQYSLELYEAMRSNPDFEPLLLARGGPPSLNVPLHEGTALRLVNGDSNQYLLISSLDEYNSFFGSATHKRRYLNDLQKFLTTYQPALVHVQHTLFLGFDILRQIRNVLPRAPIVYTLHEYQPICHRNGQMVRTNDMELCTEESPQRCHQCFPEFTPAAFFLRKRFILSHFQLVDLFLAPSKYLLSQYVRWGIPPEKIRFEEYGRLPAANLSHPDQRQARNRFGFFGQCTRFKGVDVLLKAMKTLAKTGSPKHLGHGVTSRRPRGGGDKHAGTLTVGDESKAHAWIYAANLERQHMEFQMQIKSLLEAAGDNVTWAGRYRHADLPRLMSNVDWVIVPSIWWENSPLVIQEAFQHGKPVICSDIGGMAEKVRHGVNGLHFQVGNPESLAEAIQLAAHSPDLWQKLHNGIPSVHPMDEHVSTLTRTYHDLLASAASSR